jgi:hypothetical protein
VQSLILNRLKVLYSKDMVLNVQVKRYHKRYWVGVIELIRRGGELLMTCRKRLLV